MKFVIFMIILGLCLSSCGFLRNSSKSSDEVLYNSLDQSDRKFIKQKGVLEKLNIVSSFKDSLNQDYEVQIWPKGNFSFSNNLGFVGEAEKIQIKGNTKQLREYNKTFNNQLNAVTKKVIEDQQKRKEVFSQKASSKQSSPSLKWIVSLLVLIVICFGWLKIRY